MLVTDQNIQVKKEASPVTVFMQQGIKWFRKRNYEKAIAFFDQAIAVSDDQFFQGHYWKAHCYFRRGHYGSAKFNCDLALKINPNHRKSLVLKCKSCAALEDYSGVKEINKILRKIEDTLEQRKQYQARRIAS